MDDESRQDDFPIVDTVGSTTRSADISPFRLPELTSGSIAAQSRNWKPDSDGEVGVRIEFGRAYLQQDEASQLSAGSVVTLDTQPGAPVDVCVDGRVIARGELQSLEGKFCIRVTEVPEIEVKSRAA